MFSQDSYSRELETLFRRFPSVQKSSFQTAYKPGLERMEAFDRLIGSPSKKFRSIHIAGTNGKGSVANMVCSALCGAGYHAGLYTSPHIEDFRERIRVDGEIPSKEFVYDFIQKWKKDFERLDLSFFEITTGMAFSWFASCEVDAAVVEVGLGGRLDSTNILTPEVSVVTSIGLDHMQYLGNTLSEIAAEKAGIFKRGVPAVVGEVLPETRKVFEKKAFQMSSKLVVASETSQHLWDRKDEILSRMDLQGPSQGKNLRTVLCTLDAIRDAFPLLSDDKKVMDAIEHTASRMHFHGRWERVSVNPQVICDLGHNAPALRDNFSRLGSMLESGECTSLVILYGIMADKDLGAILPLMPKKASWVLVSPATSRALPSDELLSRCRAYWSENGFDTAMLEDGGSVSDGLEIALSKASLDGERPLVYAGGSTFVVSEVIKALGLEKGLES